MRRVPVEVDLRRNRHLVSALVLQAKVEGGDEISGDDVLLKLGKAHAHCSQVSHIHNIRAMRAYNKDVFRLPTQ
jgi:hypothetical protein